MERSSSRVLEITVISGESLNISKNQPVKKNSYVTIKIADSTADSGTTIMDKDGGSYPSWNEKVLISLPMHARHLTVEVHCKTNYSGDKIIGRAKIPVSDFLNEHLPEDYLHFLSYRLRDPYGEKNGIINLSIRVKMMQGGCYSRRPANYPVAGGSAMISGYSAGGCAGAASNYSRPWTGVPVGGQVSSGVVTGVPVWRNR